MNGRSDSNISLSVVIPVQNGERTIIACLNSLASQSLRPDEIIIVDNGSTDDTVARVKEWSLTHGALQMQLAFEGKQGPSAARNRGTRLAKGRFLVFLDADCVAPPDWLKMISKQIGGGRSAVGGPYQGHPSLPAIERYAAMSWSFGTSGEEIDYSNPFISRFLLGGNMALPRRYWESTGGFNETLTVGEDLDFSFRLYREGVSMRIIPSLAVLHETSSTVSKRIRRAWRHGLLQSRIAKNYFPRHLTISFFERGFQFPFPCAVAIEGISLTKCLLFVGLLGWGRPFWALLLFFLLVLGWEARLIYRIVKHGASISLIDALRIPLDWGLVRLAMEVGRLAGSVRQGVLCW